MNAKERAQQLAEEVVGLITGLRINESEGRATVLLPIAEIAPLAEKHICAAQREAMEKCISAIEREEDLLEAMIAEGGPREEYTHNFNGLEAGAGAIRALIKQLEEE